MPQTTELQSLRLGDKCQAISTGLVIQEALSYDEWKAIKAQIDTVDGSMNWIKGDWLAYGRGKLADRYADAMDAMEYQVMRNLAWVSANVPMEIRTPALSWEHHKMVAIEALDIEAKRQWLQQAIEHGLTSLELRESIKAGKIVRTEDKGPKAGRGLLVIQGVVASVRLWKRNIMDTGKLTLTAQTREAIQHEVIEPLREVLDEIEGAIRAK